MLAQFPREVDITIDVNILEKEKPKVGRNNFGGTSDFFSSELIVNNP